MRVAARLRPVLVFVLALNLGWVELAYNATVAGGPDNLLGWPVVGWYLPARQWFWIHFSLVLLSAGGLVYLYETRYVSSPMEAVDG